MFIDYWTGAVTHTGHMQRLSGWLFPWEANIPLFSPSASQWLVPGTWNEVW